jgi:hypothetical protein
MRGGSEKGLTSPLVVTGGVACFRGEAMSRAARSELRLFELAIYLIVCHTSSPAGFFGVLGPILTKFGPVGPLDQIRVLLIK